jgi:hypothetical protein
MLHRLDYLGGLLAARCRIEENEALAGMDLLIEDGKIRANGGNVEGIGIGVGHDVSFESKG